MMYWDGDHMGGGGWALMILGMVAFWALVIVAVVFLVRSSRTGAQPLVPQTAVLAPEQLLAGRFARGEIDDTEYTHRLTVLRS